MSLQEAATAGAAAQAHEETVTGTGHAHPSDRSYVGIALILALIKPLELVRRLRRDQIDEREDHNPDHVDEVPVEAGEFDVQALRLSDPATRHHVVEG